MKMYILSISVCNCDINEVINLLTWQFSDQVHFDEDYLKRLINKDLKLENIYPIKVTKDKFIFNNEDEFNKNLDSIMRKMASKYGELVPNVRTITKKIFSETEIYNVYSIRKEDISQEYAIVPEKKYGPYHNPYKGKKYPKILKQKNIKLLISFERFIR